MEKVVLIVEDDPNNMELFKDLLHVFGYVTLTAVNGQEGISLAREKKPALILMDIQMPVLDGLQATAILKADEETRNIPIIAITAYAMKGDEEKILAAGCDGYLTKPIDTEGFIKKVGEYIT